jgi:coenzyme F420 hydrogenase subunit beta
MADRGFGKYREVVTARSSDESVRPDAQDGGTVTALLCYALEKGVIDGAVITKKGANWTPAQHVATTKKEIMESAGSIYALSPSLFQLKEAVRERALDHIAYVGLPCQIQALRKMQLYPFGARGVGERIALVIGIFCYENFSPEGLRAVVEGLCETPLKNVEKMRIAMGKFKIEDDKTSEVSLKKASKYIQEGDLVCPDLVSEYADISIGSVGSEDGWNTVFIRTSKGVEFFNKAREAGVIETKDIEKVKPGLKVLEKLALDKKERAKKNIEKRKKLGLFVTRDIYY